MGIARNENETELRGDALEGAGRERAADPLRAKKRAPDAVLRLDGEEDSLYADGLDVDDGSKPPLGTPGGDDPAR